MAREEIETKKKTLDDILKLEDADTRLGKLKALAKDVGAGYVHQEFGGITTTKTTTGETTLIHYIPISESELVQNINNALQTETMIDMSNTAASNFWIAVGAMLIALFAMLATWLGVVVNWWCNQ